MAEPKPVIPRVLAVCDVDNAVAAYLSEAGGPTALRFVDAVEGAFAHIGRHPASGSPRLAVELDIPDLRSWPLAGFPHLVFYVERDDRVDVWRVVHGRRDIPASLQD